MRKQELRMEPGRKESRVQFKRRLRRVVKSIPRADLNKAVADLARRTELLYRAKGQLFDESKEI